MAVVFLVLGKTGLESAWSTPEAAADEREKLTREGSATVYTTVRPLDSDVPTPESEAALKQLRELERQRHELKSAQMRRRNGR